MLSRRNFIRLTLAGVAAASTPGRGSSAVRRKKILVLGGTSYLGPSIVEWALERGHTLTLFNRGKTNPQLFPKLEKICGDRQPDDKADLSGLKGSRRWDAVVDVWPQDPRLVTATARLLENRTDYYFFVSTISAYAAYTEVGMDERAPLRVERPGYGGDKARSETALQSILPGRLGIVRPHAIMGPRDDSLSYHYWLSQLARNQDIVAPGDGSDFVQYVDVRDVGAWIVDSVEQARLGVYNVFSRPFTMKTFLEESRRGVHGRARLVWVAEDFLRTRKVKVFDNMPYWNPPSDRPAFTRISPEKAFRQGWTQRPLSVTAADSWASYRDRYPKGFVYPQTQWGFEWGLSPERERQILADWKKSGRAHL